MLRTNQQVNAKEWAIVEALAQGVVASEAILMNGSGVLIFAEMSSER